MNMISTGAFQTEMDASNKQNNLVAKLVSAWEKKNAKVARAGGVSLMALSLAACGSDDDDAVVADPTPVEPTPVAPVEPVAPADLVLKTDAAEVVIGVSGQNASGIISATAAKTTLNAGDEISSVTDSGATFTLTDSSGADVTAAITGDVRNFDNIVYNVDSLAVGGTAQVEIALTDFAKAKTYTFDNTYAGSIINDLVLTGTTDDSKITTSSDFSALKVTPTANTNDIEVDMSAAANTLVAVSVGANVVATASGTLNTTAATTTGLVKLTSTGNNTVTDATAAASLFATSTEGSVTITDGNSALLVDVNAAKGATLSDVALVTNLDVVAGGNVSVTNTGAGDMNIATTGTITTAGNINSTTATLSSTGASTILGNAIATMTVSGNAAAADYTMSTADHAALAKIVVEGSQDVTVAVVGSEIAGALAIDDNSTAGTFKLDVEGGAGAVTLSGDKVDDLNIKNNMAANDLTVVTGQAVDYTVDQATASDLIVGNAASASSNAVTLNLTDGVNTNNASVDINALTVTQAATVTVNADLDANTNGTSSILTAFGASASSANTTLNMGSSGASLATSITSGAAGAYGTLTLTGSGGVAMANGGGQFTANVSTLDASAMTGAVTVTATNELIGAVTIVKTGAGNDSLLLGVNTISDISTNAGNDGITLDNADYGSKVMKLDFGAGSDTLTMVNGAKLSDLAAGSSVSGLESIVLNATSTTQEIDANLLAGQTYSVSASATGATGTLNAIVQTTDTSLDLSTLVESTNVATTTAAMTAAIDASGNSSAITIKGLTGAINTITPGASASDNITGGDYADSIVITSDGLLFNASNVMLDTINGGASAASTYDAYTVGTSGTAFTIVAADNFSKSSGVEQITAVANTAAVSLTLGASAETAGISRIDLSSAGNSPANTANVSAYTSTGVTITGSAAVDTITGGAGADTITGNAGADVLAGGAGNDVFNYALTAALMSSSTTVDASLAGGAGTDTIKIGTTGTAFAIASGDAWAGVTGVETIQANANTATVDIDLANSAYTAGVRTVDISAVTAATGNTILADNFTGIYEADGMVLTGSATGVTAITGGAGDEVITGGSAADTITAGAGGDTINVGTSVGVDTVVYSAVNQTAEWTSGYAGTSVATTGMDIISGLNSGDDIEFAIYTGTAATSAANNVMDSNALTKAADLGVTIAANSVQVVRGDYTTNVFTESGTGADVLVAFDANATQATLDAEAFVLIGLGSATFTVDAGSTGIVSIT